MKKKLCALLLSASMLSSLAVPAFAVDASETNPPPLRTPGEDVVYLGVQGYGTVSSKDKENFVHRFFVDGTEKEFTIPADGGKFEIQNKLQEGYIYDVTIDGNTITAAEMEEGDVAGVLTDLNADRNRIYVDNESFTVNDDAELYDIDAQAGGATVTKITFDELKVDDTVRIVVDSDDHVTKLFRMFVAEDYTAPVSGVPGKLTLKNFLATAMEPVGTALYVYGGTWDWQDVNSSNQSMTIGLSQSWIDFFQSQDENYHYKNPNPSESYYPHQAWNQYYYAGIDCSGYVGWSVYNLMNTENSTVADNKGYVMSATKQAGVFASNEGWGTMDMGDVLMDETTGKPWVDEDGDGRRIYEGHEFKPGDIFSMNGHVWISLGTCKDGSIVFMHSTPNTTNGAGVQISAIGPNKNCEAYKLANQYMNKYFPQWSERYGDQVLCLTFDSYTKVYGDYAGKFSWNLKNGVISDPDGYAKMTPAQILADLFDTYEGEAVYLGVKDYGDRNTNWDHKPTFQHQFFVDGDVRTFTVDDEKNYSLQNQLMEGYVYDIDVNANEVTAVELKDKGHDDVVMGTVTAKSGSSITVDGQTLDLGNSTEVYEITSEAGGASVKEASVSVGDSVKVMVNGDQAKTVYKTFVAEEYKAPVSGTPGEKTLKNFLATAMEPVGTALYVYGGTWDWQDVNSSNQSMTIGLSQSWIDFFQSQDENYHYKNPNPSESYYPHQAWNQYYYAGIDCSGYVGWSVYNLMNTENSTVADNKGYVMSATKQAGVFASNEGWGTMDMGDVLMDETTGKPWVDEDGDGRRIYEGHEFKPGDIFSMNGHVWISLGTCKDGSIVFMHSTPNTTNGAGVQISAIGPNKNCEAYKLANQYMNKYFPQWSERYGDQVLCLTFDSYTKVYGDYAGKFSWNLKNGVISDPDGYADMTPAEILADLFHENTGSSSGGSDHSDPTYAIRASAGKGGSISPKGTVRVEKNDSKTYTITADKGYAIADVTVNGKSVGAVDSYTFKNVTSDQTIRATFALEGAAEQPGFSDVSKNDWFYDAVQDAVDMGLMAGVSADRFDPKGTVTRAMVAQILYAREGKPTVSGAAAISDVPANAWFHNAMQWAKGQGVIAGYPDGRMDPNAPVTREQLAVILHSYAQKKGMNVSKTADLSGYADSAAVSVWAKDAMSWAVGSGLISGRSATTLAPAGSATRAECAVIFTQMFQK